MGALEALVEEPADRRAASAAVICHPHPLHGGTMTNKVVHMLARTFHEHGVATVRFNYRGVGASAGTYGDGKGEADDAAAVIDWAARRWQATELWLAGFSFGGAVAYEVSTRRVVTGLILVAPAVQRVTGNLPEPRCPMLIVQGDHDDVIDPQAVIAWAGTLAGQHELVVLPGIGHYFHGRLEDLRTQVRDWVAKVAVSHSVPPQDS